MNNVNQHHQRPIKYFPIEFNVDGTNEDLQHIKHDMKYKISCLICCVSSFIPSVLNSIEKYLIGL